MKSNSIKTMLLGFLLMFFGVALVMSTTVPWRAGIAQIKDTVLAVGSLVFLAGFITGVVGFYKKDL